MKMKVKTLLDRKADTEKLEQLIDACADKCSGEKVEIPRDLAVRVDVVLLEYVDLMNALLDSAEVTI